MAASYLLSEAKPLVTLAYAFVLFQSTQLGTFPMYICTYGVGGSHVLSLAGTKNAHCFSLHVRTSPMA